MYLTIKCHGFRQVYLFAYILEAEGRKNLRKQTKDAQEKTVLKFFEKKSRISEAVERNQKERIVKLRFQNFQYDVQKLIRYDLS